MFGFDLLVELCSRHQKLGIVNFTRTVRVNILFDFFDLGLVQTAHIRKEGFLQFTELKNSILVLIQDLENIGHF